MSQTQNEKADSSGQVFTLPDSDTSWATASVRWPPAASRQILVNCLQPADKPRQGFRQPAGRFSTTCRHRAQNALILNLSWEWLKAWGSEERVPDLRVRPVVLGRWIGASARIACSARAFVHYAKDKCRKWKNEPPVDESSVVPQVRGSMKKRAVRSAKRAERYVVGGEA